MNSNQIVSFDNEKLILVNPIDEIVGYEDKLECHIHDGILHRAFSIFIFNSKNELLVQQRAFGKMLWPGFWSNSCCSHPRKGESYEQATERRLFEELGLRTRLVYTYRFQYKARYGEAGSENELCSVYIGRSNDEPVVNSTEIKAWKYIAIDELTKQLDLNPDFYTPWFKMEWRRLMSEYKDAILYMK